MQPPGDEHPSILLRGTEPSRSAGLVLVQSPVPQALPSLGCSVSGRPSGRKGRSCREEVRDVLTFSCSSRGMQSPWVSSRWIRLGAQAGAPLEPHSCSME